MSDPCKDVGAEEGALPTISDDLVVTKYKMAAEIVNRKKCHVALFLINY